MHNKGDLSFILCNKAANEAPREAAFDPFFDHQDETSVPHAQLQYEHQYTVVDRPDSPLLHASSVVYASAPQLQEPPKPKTSRSRSRSTSSSSSSSIGYSEEDIREAAALLNLPPQMITKTTLQKSSKYCEVDGCLSRAKHSRRCWKHGGSVECSVPDCKSRAKVRGVCWTHGGGAICSVDGCKTISVTHGVCWAHGGGKRCGFRGCRRAASSQTEDFCRTHFNSHKQRHVLVN